MYLLCMFALMLLHVLPYFGETTFQVEFDVR
jgi:hypothetical protein